MYKLYSITIDNDGEDNNYRIVPDEDSKKFGANEYAIRADATMLKKFLRRCRVADMTVQPRSYRSLTYSEIVDSITKQNCKVYIFSHLYPKTLDELELLMRK
jgi:hypothetical protein